MYVCISCVCVLAVCVFCFSKSCSFLTWYTNGPFLAEHLISCCSISTPTSGMLRGFSVLVILMGEVLFYCGFNLYIPDN